MPVVVQVEDDCSCGLVGIWKRKGLAWVLFCLRECPQCGDEVATEAKEPLRFAWEVT